MYMIMAITTILYDENDTQKFFYKIYVYSLSHNRTKFWKYYFVIWGEIVYNTVKIGKQYIQ